MNYIKFFTDIRLTDVAQVGGKNASLGQMIGALSKQGIRIPDGFAITVDAYWAYLAHNKLQDQIQKELVSLSTSHDVHCVESIGKSIRDMLYAGKFPTDLQQAIEAAYQKLSQEYKQENIAVAVRSSATAEDLAGASFAGQQETFLNVVGTNALLDACKKCIASLFTDRAISYRIEKGFNHADIALSIGVQKMARSDRACSGVAFSLDTETGFKDAVIINASYGLGESIVQGIVTPDEYIVYKKPIATHTTMPIIDKKRGDKKIKMIYQPEGSGIQKVAVSVEDQQSFALSDTHIQELAHMVCIIEDYYTKLNNRWTPVDVEWAIDGIDGLLYIVQARPETVHAQHNQIHELLQFQLNEHTSKPILTGQSVGQSIATGKARVIRSIAEIDQVQPGDIIVTTMTDPDWVSVMKQAGGIITDCGGRTCHAAIVSRELGICAIVGTGLATQCIKTGDTLTLDCSQGATGFVYPEKINWSMQRIPLDKIPQVPTNIMLNIADPQRAFSLSFLPVAGVGLARIEFIIATHIKIHPLALLYPEKITDVAVQKSIDSLTSAYDIPHTWLKSHGFGDPGKNNTHASHGLDEQGFLGTSRQKFFIDTLAYGIATIAAAFYPRPVIVRFSDFKTNEYRNLIGGTYFEPVEENPMLGFRGAIRYYHGSYKAAFALECAAIKKVRNELGFNNVAVMVPFVRTVDEAHKVIDCLASHGLKRGVDGLQIIMMCEIPSNVICIDAFSKLFDGFSIGSNDLTQLTLGVDRDSGMLAPLFDERDQAMLEMFTLAITGAHRNKRTIGICGQAPSDYPEIAQFLMKHAIDSMSLNPDSVIPFLFRYKE